MRAATRAWMRRVSVCLWVCLLAAGGGAWADGPIAGTGFEVPAVGASSHNGSGGELGFAGTPVGSGDGSVHVVNYNVRSGSHALLLDDRTQGTTFNVTFSLVDLTGYDDVMLSFYWYTPGAEYEPAGVAGADWLTATATFAGAAGSPITFLNVDGGGMDLNNQYQLASVRLPAGATSVSLGISAYASWGNNNEQVFLDDVLIAPYEPPPPPPVYSGIYPHTAVFNTQDECGIGAVVPWAGELRYMTYPPHYPNGDSSNKLYSLDADLNVTVESASVGGTHANRMIHAETNQLIIGPYFIDDQGTIRTVLPSAMPGRLTGVARHLTDPANKVYFYTMEEGLYEVDVHTLAVTQLHKDLNGGGTNLLPGDHGKGAYTGQGHLIVSNNGGGGVLAEWDGTGSAGDPASWTIVDRNKYTDVTGPGGLMGAPDEDAPVWAIGWDAKSVLLNVRDNGTWTRYRLPKSSHTQDADNGWYTEWPRIRDVGMDKLLMDMHCTFFEFPETFSTTSTGGIRPMSTHLKMVADFAEWNGQIVMASDDASKMDNPAVGQSQSNLWFTTGEKLRELGPPAGWGGPLVKEPLAAAGASEAFLFAGYEKRVLHMTQTGATDAIFTVEVDRDGDGQWTALDSFTVPAGGYAWHVFDADVPGEWVRVRSDRDLSSATAYFHYGSAPRPGDPTPFVSLAAAPQGARNRSEGILRPRGGGLGTLQFLANVVDQNQQIVAEGYYEIGPDMNLRKVIDPTAAQYLQDNFSVTDKGFEIDEASVIVTDSTGKRYRLPKGPEMYDEPWATGWPRGLREVVTERSLLNACGTFYEVPRDGSGGFRTMRPIATHDRMIYDFASWRGMLVLAGAFTDAAEDEHYVVSDDAQVGLWFGTVDDLWIFGAPRGVGGPWLDTSVQAGVASDPYLMAGYDNKHVDLSHDGEETIGFTIQVDFLADGTWQDYLTIPVGPGETVGYDFPDGYSAHWVRLLTDADTTATATFTYVPEPATIGLLIIGAMGLVVRRRRR